MTSKQMQREIAKLEGEDHLSAGASRRLRELKAALPEQQKREQRKAEARAKGQAYGAVPATPSGPVDKGLDGDAWISFFNRYCDPKGLSQAKAGEGPKRESSRKEKAGRPGTFSFNGRRVVINSDKRVIKARVIESDFVPTTGARRQTRESRDGNRLEGFAFGRDRGLEILKLADTGKLAQLGERRVARLTPKLAKLRELLSAA